ncbi:hypothetical protein ERJ75_000006000 [Trypanosoma vivax]|nr:hypothetical protein ERJ75_000006000 [Trypanosoma vivax]
MCPGATQVVVDGGSDGGDALSSGVSRVADGVRRARGAVCVLGERLCASEERCRTAEDDCERLRAELCHMEAERATLAQSLEVRGHRSVRCGFSCAVCWRSFLVPSTLCAWWSTRCAMCLRACSIAPVLATMRLRCRYCPRASSSWQIMFARRVVACRHDWRSCCRWHLARM